MAKPFSINNVRLQQVQQTFGANMKHGLAKYNAGCRCDLCKQVTSEYYKARRRRIAESVGEFVVPTGPSLLSLKGDALTSANATPQSEIVQQNIVEAAVSAEIDALGDHKRPGLAATALALARIMDHPRAVSSQPAAARQLVAILETLSKRSRRRGKLAVVKSMTEAPRVDVCEM